MTAPEVKSLQCPRCGSPITLRVLQHSQNVVCSSCLSVLDAQDPGLRVLQTSEARVRHKPLIPLGARGKLRGEPWEAIGFQIRTITVEGERYSWAEYLLFNPYKGFRYLTEYQGHWNDVINLKTLPTEARQLNGRPTVSVHGETFRHFQTATAETTFVLGEFPWQVRVGDLVTVSDYVSPPRMVSSEVTPGEKTWSAGEYTPGAHVWDAFKLPGDPPRPRGVFANQPSPHGSRVQAIWSAFALLLALFVALAVVRFGQQPREVWNATQQYFPLRTDDDNVVVLPPLVLIGRTSNLELALHADVLNSWIFFNFALINEGTGKAYEFGRQISFYEGYDGGERWTEGSRRDRVRIPSIPAGRYLLRIAPEGAENTGPVNYSVRLRRDVPSPAFFFLALLLLVIPPVFLALRAGAFESARWRESDYAPSGGDDDE